MIGLISLTFLGCRATLNLRVYQLEEKETVKRIEAIEKELVRLGSEVKLEKEERLKETEITQQGLERILEEIEKRASYKFPPLPEEITFCEEIVPLKRDYVWERLFEGLIIEINKSLDMGLIFLRTGRWFPVIEKALAEAGMPLDLKYLFVIESNLNHMANSSKGARGISQFDRLTARQCGLRCGLRRDSWIDERYDPFRSIEAAIKHLKERYTEFGNWSSVLATYNMNKDKYKERLEEQETDDFYEVRQIPMQTQRFDYRAIAVKLIMENPEKYGYPSWEVINQIKYKSWQVKKIEIVVKKRRKSISEIVEELKSQYPNLTHREFLDYNPHILKAELPKGTYNIYIPEKK